MPCRFSADEASDLIDPKVPVRVGSSFSDDVFESALPRIGDVRIEDWLFV